MEETLKITDPGWSDWLISQLDPSEMDAECHPKVDGLRRLAEIHLGEIVLSEAKIVSVLPEKTTAEYTIEFETGVDNKGYTTTKRYTSAADCGPKNCDAKFGIYAAAIAETRAEARALRKALRLKVVSAEELNGPKDKKSEDKDTLINDNQIAFLQHKSIKLNIDVLKFINLDVFGDDSIEDIRNISMEKASKMVNYLGKVQAGKAVLPEDCYIQRKAEVSNEV